MLFEGSLHYPNPGDFREFVLYGGRPLLVLPLPVLRARARACVVCGVCVRACVRACVQAN
jgi:hypothetical protein